MTDNYFKHAKVAVLMYSIDDELPVTLRSVNGWLKELEEWVYLGDTCAVVLAGNKVDTPISTWVDLDSINALAEANGLKYRLTLSALTGHNLEELVSLIIEAYKSLPAPGQEGVVNLLRSHEKPDDSCCYK
eukprot:m.202447 g.202447  ORF g.202447 m.202447 type:complete len:131 (+) comp39612_c0_seq22:661-1053(+)